MKSKSVYACLTAFSLALVVSIETLASDEREFSEKIKVGLTKDAVTALFGGAPDTESCRNILGLSACRLTWSKGLVAKKRYEVDFIAGRVIAVGVDAQKGLY